MKKAEVVKFITQTYLIGNAEGNSSSCKEKILIIISKPYKNISFPIIINTQIEKLPSL